MSIWLMSGRKEDKHARDRRNQGQHFLEGEVGRQEERHHEAMRRTKDRTKNEMCTTPLNMACVQLSVSV